jgi:hypothetical protein
MNPAASPRWQIALGACACAAAGAYMYAVDPSSGLYPSCLFYRTTGLYCAGCGATRACHALLHGRVLEALHDNLLFVSLLPVGIVLGALVASRAWRADRWPAIYFSERGLLRGGLGFVALMVLFMAVRNLPGTAFDWLRPLA